MNWKMFLLAGILLGASASCNSTKRTVDANGVVYACPMHPEMTGKMGDKCAKCNMDLKARPMACCPMHPDCTGKAGAKCPKCSMPLEEPVTPYVCPMHPDQEGVKGGHCPKCHMDLVPQKPPKGNG